MIADDLPGPRRFLDLSLGPIDADLALDEALLIEAEEGRAGPAVRVWEPANYSVVLGASGRLLDEVDVAACRAQGVAVARRSSGGGTVVVGPGVLNAAIVVPIGVHPDLAAVDRAQLFLLGRLADRLRAAGVDARVRGSGDLAVGDRKVSGSAQRRLRHHVLVHATILRDFDLGRISRYLAEPSRRPDYRGARAHGEFVTNVNLDRAALVGCIRAAWLDPGRPVDVAEVPAEAVRRLQDEKFADPAWVARL